MIVLYFTPLLLLLLIPSERLYLYYLKISERLRRDSLLTRGESMLFWLDSFGLEGNGFDLGKALPPKNHYKGFGVSIHRAWNQVQQKGGELSPYFRVIKSLLRVDLKRQARETESLNLMRLQFISILILVWIFLFTLNFVIDSSLSPRTLILIFLWQVIGILIGFFLVQKIKKKFFEPVSELLSLLLNLHSLRFSGDLTQAALTPQNPFNDPQAELVLRRMNGLLQRWRLMGSEDTESLDDLREDIVALSQHRSEKFLKVGPALFLVWCCVFVLPVLFAASVLGLAGQLNV